MQFASPQIGRDEALAFLTRRRFHRFTRILPRRSAPTTLRLELIYMPHFLVRVPFMDVENGVATQDVDEFEKNSVGVCVEAYSGAFTLRDYTSELIDDAPPAACDCFLPRLTEEDAVRIAREGLLRTTLNMRTKTRRVNWNLPARITLLQHPFWVHYHARGRGYLDIRLMDAVTGERPGSKTKGAVLDAFVASARTTMPSTYQQREQQL